MKKYTLIALFFCFVSAKNLYGQENSFHSLEEAITNNIEKLKNLIGNYDNIFLTTNTDSSLIMPAKIYKVENGINAKFLKKNDKNYFIEVRIAAKLNFLKIDITNYRVIKLSSKKIHLINLSNGQTYVIH